MKCILLSSAKAFTVSVIFLSLVSCQESSISHADTQPATTAHTQQTLADCQQALASVPGGWCELKVSKQDPGISSVWPAKQPRIHQTLGPGAVMVAWSSAAWDKDNKTLYFMGGGGNNYGGNEVYRFSLQQGEWKRLTDPSPLDHWTGTKNRRWIPDTRQVPAASYIHDGLLFNEKTGTLILLASEASTGAKIRPEASPPQEAYLAEGAKPQQYEFNPSETETRNGLAPLTWRRIGQHSWSRGRSVQLPDGTLLLGSLVNLYEVRQGADGELLEPELFSRHRQSRGAASVYDPGRDRIWTAYHDSLVAVDRRGVTVEEIKLPFYSSRSVSLDKDGKLVLWDGIRRIYVYDPDNDETPWRTLNWNDNGPYNGLKGRVYGKWVHLGNNFFVGVSNYKHGIWVYKHPQDPNAGRPLSQVNIQQMVNKAKPNSTLKIPAGVYPKGLVIRRPLTLDLEGVELLNVANDKGLLDINTGKGPVIIRNFTADADNGAAQFGNLAGIRITGVDFNVALDNVHIRRTAMGIMTDNRGGSLSIRNSHFEDIGFYKNRGLSHVIYAGVIDSLSIMDTIIERSLQLGHLVKSRAASTVIRNSQVLGLDARHSRVIDISCGGRLSVENSVLQSSSHTDNQDFIAVGVEPPSNCKRGLKAGNVSLNNNVIVFDRLSKTNNKNRLFTWRTKVESLSLSNNVIVNRDDNDLLDQSIQGVYVKSHADGNQLYHSREEAGLSSETDTRP